MKNGGGSATANPNKKKKKSSREGEFRFALDRCAKTGDLASALALFDSAVSEGLPLSAFHYNSLLHLCSSAVGDRPLAAGDDHSDSSFPVNAGFRIFDRMLASGIRPNEATITSMARIAANKPDEAGRDLAFDLARTMVEKYGVAPKLRTYSPALFAFCRNSEADKAYEVEAHMGSMGIGPEETEISALLDVSAKAGRAEKVYGYLQKLRSSVGCVSNSTAEILEGWFRSEKAAEVGREDWDVGRLKNAIVANGGGWHGLGWLGKGEWKVCRVNVSAEGHCSGCGQRLVCADIDRMETEKFAESVAGLALERETKSNFRNFQVK